MSWCFFTATEKEEGTIEEAREGEGKKPSKIDTEKFILNLLISFKKWEPICIKKSFVDYIKYFKHRGDTDIML